MNVLEAATKAIALIAEGRAALDGIRDAIKDGSAAVKTNDLDELEALLEQEKVETRAAHDALAAAIADAKQN